MLTAFIDDSGNEPSSPVFVLAGFLAPTEDWVKFSDEWRLLCAEPPATPDFHMANAERLSRGYGGEGTSEQRRERRDKRVNNLAMLVAKYARLRLQTAITWQDYDQLLKGKVPPQTDNPYFWCHAQLIMGIAKWQKAVGLSQKVKFVFDRDLRAEKFARDWHEKMLEAVPPFARYVLSDPPSFEHDAMVLPLKAADMLAWHIRRDAAMKNKEPPRDALRKFSEIPSVVVPLNRPRIKKIVQNLGGVLLRPP